MRTPTLARLEANRHAHASVAAIERQSGCMPGRRSRTARRAHSRWFQVSGEARRRGTLPVWQGSKARRSGHKHRSQAHLLCARLAVRPHPSVVVCRTAVVLSIGKRYHTRTPAQPGIAADRFAREIVGILRLLPARSRQLNANPLGRPSAAPLVLAQNLLS